ncbi:hypothetical protein BaRGS_00001306 [Batillaria attramentaria]|uniref:Uncharacterized protein n=1 Tax=Batillaria attramentaria TaxID=370345 RepID=A0ABD0M6T6_9CAEN
MDTASSNYLLQTELMWKHYFFAGVFVRRQLLGNESTSLVGHHACLKCDVTKHRQRISQRPPVHIIRQVLMSKTEIFHKKSTDEDVGKR